MILLYPACLPIYPVNVYVIFPYDCAALTFACVVIPQDGCCGGNYSRQRAQWSLQLKPRTKNSILVWENPFNRSLMDFVNCWQNDVKNDKWCKIPFFPSSRTSVIFLSSQGIDCFSFSLTDWLVSWYFDPKVLKIRFSDFTMVSGRMFLHFSYHLNNSFSSWCGWLTTSGYRWKISYFSGQSLSQTCTNWWIG